MEPTGETPVYSATVPREPCRDSRELRDPFAERGEARVGGLSARVTEEYLLDHDRKLEDGELSKKSIDESRARPRA